MKYTQLTLEKRYHISALKKLGYSQKNIALELDVHPATISRELKRNTFNGKYQPISAQIEYVSRQKKKNKHKAVTKVIEKYIRKKLKLDWSPEQISGRMKIDIKQSIHHETIYQFIYRNKANGGRLYRHLRHRNKKYHCRTKKYQQRGTIVDRIMINKRPKIVEQKNRIGDFEVDTIIGKNHKEALVTVVDKKSKFSLIRKVNSKQASEVSEALIEMLTPIKPILFTITSDNGKEFAYHKDISLALNVDFYFANPYHSWERGLNEHTNGLIRQYIPKKSEFTNISKEEIVTIQNLLNNRPRKSLKYKTPLEVFMKDFYQRTTA
jgi:IS30 family transposase